MKSIYTKIGLACLMACVPLLMAPRNGSGTYSLPAGNPVASGTTISSTVHNNTNNDIATAITGSIAKNGETTPTANLPMGNFRHTSVGDASARTHYAVANQVQDGDYNLVGSVSGTNTVVGSLTPAISAYAAGMQVVLLPANANTGATTLNLNGVGALDLQKYTSAGQVAVAANDLRAGIPALLLLDTGADDWILLNPYSGSLGDITIGTLTATTINASGTVTGGNLTTAGTLTSATITNSGTATSDVVTATTTLTVAGQSARDATNLFSSGTVPAARLPGSFAGFANPTATIGLSAVNGSAATAMRSDGAPALSQSIAPTWTARHIFNLQGAGASAPVEIRGSAFVGYSINQTGGAADNRLWDITAVNEQLRFRIDNDADSVQTDWLTVDRTGTTVDEVEFPGSFFSIGSDDGVRDIGGGNPWRGQIRGNSSAFRVATSSSGIATDPVLIVQHEVTSGNNNFINFLTDTTSVARGSITFNRGGGLVAFNTTSDERLKKNFKPAPSARGVIDCIKIESYDWRETGNHVQHGVVAQRLDKCAPYAVTKGNVWQVDKSTLIPALIKYTQEQDARVANLEKQLQEQQVGLLIKEVQELRARMSKLEAEPQMMRFHTATAANRGSIQYNQSGSPVRYSIAVDRRAK